MPEAVPQNIIEYLKPNGECPSRKWLAGFRDHEARARVRRRIDRLGQGNPGKQWRWIEEKIYELKVDLSPGYRIYLAHIDESNCLLLLGGTKFTQPRDIENAKEYWDDYQRRIKHHD